MQSMNTELSRLIDHTLTPLIAERSEKLYIIDPPNHPNVGDSAIFLGELAFLRRHYPRARVDFVDTENYTPACDRFIRDSSLILLHGGGNFGEIWPRHHAIRVAIMDRFPGIPMIQFPQSIAFTTQAAIDGTARAIERQGNFTLLVRDHRSLAFAQKHFPCVTLLCPDMAFALGDIGRQPASIDYLCLLRGDKEGIADHASLLRVLSGLSGSLDVVDWIEESRTRTQRWDRRLRKAWRNIPSTVRFSRSLAFRLRERYARERVSFGLNLLSKGTTVVTDRLHAHILCCLLGVQHMLFDSLDGKISALYETWTKGAKNARLVSSVDEFAGMVDAPRPDLLIVPGTRTRTAQ